MAMTASAQRGLDSLRRVTQAFIDDDPYPVVLVSNSTKTKKPGGGYDMGAGVSRGTQTFKLVASFGDDGVQTSEGGGQTHSWKYTLIGAWDAQIEIGDTWTDGDTKYRVVSLLQNNGYETRAAVEATGRDPNYG